MNNVIYIVFILTTFGCHENSESLNRDHLTVSDKEAVGVDSIIAIQNVNRISDLISLKYAGEFDDYISVKSEIDKLRWKLNSDRVDSDSISSCFESSLLNRIIPFWEGTEWSFEGHTSKPNVGTVACGYFVSTTLQDVGLNLNRYKLAQQNPLNEARSLSLNMEVMEFVNESPEATIADINDYLKEGVHFIGFDLSHVGFILKKEGNLYLIHSNYINAEGVLIEPIELSEVFPWYNRFYIVELSTNEELLESWVTNKEIEILTE